MICSAVICAAGGGTRMGKNKALCRLPSGETFLSSIVSLLHRVDSEMVIVVVVGAQIDLVRQTHEHLSVQWVENTDWARNHMFDSLSLGLKFITENTGVLHWPVDCIGVTFENLKQLVEAPQAPFANLTYNGKSGHPLRIHADVVTWMKQHGNAFSSLRDVMKHFDRLRIEASGQVPVNCNNPEMLADFVARNNKI